MNGGDRTFHSEVDWILEEFERRRRTENADQARRKDEWRRGVHEFREVARRVIVPTLREIKEPLRARGLRPFISNNSRHGLTIWLEVDADRMKPILLMFRLDADRRRVEVEGLTQNGPERLEAPIEECDRDFVEAVVVSFLRQLP